MCRSSFVPLVFRFFEELLESQSMFANENTCNSAALIVIKHVVVIVIGKLVMNHLYFLLKAVKFLL